MLRWCVAVKQYFLYDGQSVFGLFDALAVRLGRLGVVIVRPEVSLVGVNLFDEVVPQVLQGQCSVTVSNSSWALYFTHPVDTPF